MCNHGELSGAIVITCVQGFELISNPYTTRILIYLFKLLKIIFYFRSILRLATKESSSVTSVLYRFNILKRFSFKLVNARQEAMV